MGAGGHKIVLVIVWMEEEWCCFPEELRDHGFSSCLLKAGSMLLGYEKEKRRKKGDKCILEIPLSVWRLREAVKGKQLLSARDECVFGHLEWSLALGDCHMSL